ncbi:protein-methionine-sulfoxide reductase heme-binding subunit MsrQ [Fuscibacter oryzae]|uniref:Protein-methionine-sulfoxide reductase heme-binding subunit MsrQ n=1 Tax=Fuscibacter oryzae TaxID=2803939 RepID=A0A8J7MVC8_9RHOB|nr:protein-methionine-sulfoxide reductase heme-binding subunit MsrQ [Fuscibacter oryzae]MBL4929198.1 protein-methionine-sulfoxide reductase heme-binding subunit MsrQ [Fuscibacter oryzae]
MEQINSYLRRLPTWVVYLGGAIPAALLLYGAFFGGLGPDPVKGLERPLGEWGLRFLIASLAVTPLLRVGLRLLKFRRALGLLGFFYILAHFMVWIGLDMGLLWTQIAQDLVKRPYIIVGFAGFLMLLPLAITSNDGVIRRMGGRAWRRLHKLAYPAILAGAVHFLMIGKVYTTEALIYLGLVGVLLVVRLIPQRKRQLQTA